MTVVGERHLTTVEVEAAMDALFSREPSADPTLWRTHFETLSANLERARRLRSRARMLVIALISLAAVARIFLYAPPLTQAEMQRQASLTPMMMVAGWVPQELNSFMLATTIGVVAIEFAITRALPILRREDTIVSLLRYYGSSVKTEEMPL
jgi:hypothetical protein